MRSGRFRFAHDSISPLSLPAEADDTPVRALPIHRIQIVSSLTRRRGVAFSRTTRSHDHAGYGSTVLRFALHDWTPNRRLVLPALADEHGLPRSVLPFSSPSMTLFSSSLTPPVSSQAFRSRILTRKRVSSFVSATSAMTSVPTFRPRSTGTIRPPELAPTWTQVSLCPAKQQSTPIDSY